MISKRGWFRVPRTDIPLLKGDEGRRAVWQWILANVRFQEQTMRFNGQNWEVDIGEVATSQPAILKAVGGTMTSKRLRNFMAELEAQGYIKYRGMTNKGFILTLKGHAEPKKGHAEKGTQNEKKGTQELTILAKKGHAGSQENCGVLHAPPKKGTQKGTQEARASKAAPVLRGTQKGTQECRKPAMSAAPRGHKNDIKERGSNSKKEYTTQLTSENGDRGVWGENPITGEPAQAVPSAPSGENGFLKGTQNLSTDYLPAPENLDPAWKVLGKADPGPIPAPAREYYWEGQVIRLNEKDFKQWLQDYQHIDVRAALRDYEHWLFNGIPEEKRKQWFQIVRRKLHADNAKALAAAQGEYEKERARLDFEAKAPVNHFLVP